MCSVSYSPCWALNQKRCNASLGKNSRREFLRPSNKEGKTTYSALRAGRLILDVDGESESRQKQKKTDPSFA